MKFILTILNHDDETTEALTFTEFIKRFNNEQMSDAIFSIVSISHPDGKNIIKFCDVTL